MAGKSACDKVSSVVFDWCKGKVKGVKIL